MKVIRDAINHMMKNPRVLFYIGFLIFLIGDYSTFLGLKFLEFLQLVGTTISVVSVIFWLRATTFKEIFRRDPRQDTLTYFWNKIAVRLWSGM